MENTLGELGVLLLKVGMFVLMVMVTTPSSLLGMFTE